MNDSEPRNPFTKKGFIVGAVIVGALALSAIVLGVTSLGTGGGGATTAASGTPTPTSTVSAEAESVCGLSGYEESGTLTAPPTTEWTIVGTMAAPSSAEAGPGETDSDGVRTCYAHTVEGALFAASNLWAMGSDARLAPLAVEQLTAPGPGRDAAIAADTQQSNTGTSVQIAGFKVLSYDGENATIDTAFELNTGSLISFPSAVKWIDGDWKLVVTDEGQPPFRPTTLQNLGGYIVWAGVQ